jgi:hypothetical protein
MHLTHYRVLSSAIILSLFILPGCGSSSSSSSTSSEVTSTPTTAEDLEDNTDGTTDTDSSGTTLGALDPDMFVSGALVSDPVIVDCTLSDGTETTCYQIEGAGVPAKQTVGPFCPPTTSSSAEAGGIWLKDGEVYDIDGDFILNLAGLYADNNWKLYDDQGNVKITDTQVSCEAAAQPDVADEYNNYCVECSLDYIDGGISATYLIPTTPTPADTTGSVTQVGIALNGSELSAPAPLADIIGNYTIAAFDDCGGHINTHQSYHYHAATGCTEVGVQADGHAALLGYALDGYGIYGMKDSEGNEESLDECRGITDETRGYHYHAAGPGENMFIGCFHGKTVASTTGNAGGPPAGGPPQ